MQTKLDNLFDSYINKKSIFKNREALQQGYTPSILPHREDQINQLGQILAPALKLQLPSNIFIYGKTGTGKTAVSRLVGKKLEKAARKANIPINVIYVNCKLSKTADTEYRLFAHLARMYGLEIPKTGLPTQFVIEEFFNVIDSKKQVLIIILDEIDKLINKSGDEFLYNITRMNAELKTAKVSIIGISNIINFLDSIDPRIKSSLSEEELLFPPYNAFQLQNILEERAKEAFEEGVLDDSVIPKCSAYAAREHGDARRALDLLRVSGEVCERKGMSKVLPVHVDEAEAKIDIDKVMEIIRKQPRQSKAVLYSILMLENQRDSFATGDIYDFYVSVCNSVGMKSLTQRRVSDLISELDLLGVISSKVISKGRYGRTRNIDISISKTAEKKMVAFLTSEFGK